jgi:hypothetical protein
MTQVPLAQVRIQRISRILAMIVPSNLSGIWKIKKFDVLLSSANTPAGLD